MQHSELVSALKKKPEDIIDSLTPNKVDMLHMLFALPGEVGELIDAVKKHIFYEGMIDRENVVEELGDIEFYLEGLRQALNISREETLSHNINKLSKRYSKLTFSNEDAIIRADKQ